MPMSPEHAVLLARLAIVLRDAQNAGVVLPEPFPGPTPQWFVSYTARPDWQALAQRTIDTLTKKDP